MSAEHFVSCLEVVTTRKDNYHWGAAGDVCVCAGCEMKQLIYMMAD